MGLKVSTFKFVVQVAEFVSECFRIRKRTYNIPVLSLEKLLNLCLRFN